MSLLAHLDQQIQNMSEMMRRLGLDPAEVVQHRRGLDFTAAIRACEICPRGDVCHDWLVRAAHRLGAPPAFCPNAERFARLIREKPQGAAAGEH